MLNMTYNRTGTLFAVYCFLEKELGVKWIKPGDQGIFFNDRESVSLQTKEFSWTPPLIQRNIRTMSSYRDQVNYGQYAPKEFQMTESEVIKKQTDVLTWMRRMRMGRSKNFLFGHAFTTYWNKYKDTNPDIFALNGKGERKPLKRDLENVVRPGLANRTGVQRCHPRKSAFLVIVFPDLQPISGYAGEEVV